MLKELTAKHGAWVALWIGLIGAALYSRPPIPIDETRYLSVAWEMWHNGDFLVPHINGVPYSHKPPLLFWLIDLAWAVFGVHEFVARMVAPIFGLLSTFLTIRFAEKLWPELSYLGRTIPYVMLGMLIWSLYSSLTMFDTLLTTFVLLCLMSIYSAAKLQQPVWKWLQAGFFLGLGILAKGPVIFVYVLPVVVLAPFWSKGGTTSWLKWYAGGLLAMVLGIGIALCWALPAASAGGKEYADAILLHQTAGRVVHSFAHSRPFYWYLALCPLLFFPWIFWLPAWRPTRTQWHEPATRFCLIVAGAALLFLSLISGKQIHYVLPVMPVVALLISRNLANMQESRVKDRFPLFIILVSIGIALIFLPLMPLKGGDRVMLAKLPFWLPIIPVMSAMPLLFFRRSSYSSVMLVSSSTLALFVGLHLSLTSPLHQTYSQRDVGRLLKKMEENSSSVAVFPPELSGQFQFAGHLQGTLYPAKSRKELMRWATTHPRGYSLLFARDRKSFQITSNNWISEYKNGWLEIAPNNELLGEAVVRN